MSFVCSRHITVRRSLQQMSVGSRLRDGGGSNDAAEH